MKSKRTRVLTATILIITMVFSLVGCGAETPNATLAPTSTPTPTSAPEVLPVLTPSPDIPDEKDEVSENFGIKINGYSGEFGTNLENADGDEIAPGYFEIVWDNSQTADQHYSIDFEIEVSDDDNDYELSVFIPSSNTAGTSTVTFASSELLDYTLNQESLILELKNADTYSILSDVTVTDCAIDYGAWNRDDDPEEFEFSLNSSLEIKKQPTEIKIPPAVICEGEYSLLVKKSDSSNDPYIIEGTTDSKTLYLPATFQFDGGEIGLTYKVAHIPEGEIADHKVEIVDSFVYNGETYSEIEDLNDALSNYEITNVSDTSIHIISGYDYTEIIDVIKSIDAIDHTSSEFFYAGSNAEHQIPIATERFDALSETQRLYFEGMAPEKLEFLEEAQEEYLNYIITENFNATVENSSLPKTGFNVSSSKDFLAYQEVESYFSALSKESKALIKTLNSESYQAYENALKCVTNAEIENVEVLIVGAHQTYLKAIENGSAIIYQDATGNDIVSNWAYINSPEVIELTNYALAAFEEISAPAREQMKESTTTDNAIENKSIATFKADKNTCYNALVQLSNMNEMAKTMSAIEDFANVQEYAENSISYDRITRLIYGKNGGMYFPEYTGGTVRYAMRDIASAPTRNYEKITEEYKEWVKYILAIEDYKTTAVVEFMSEIKSAVSDLSKDDYSDEILSKASGNNVVYMMIMGAITAEEISFNGTPFPSISGTYANDVFRPVDILGGESKVEITPFIFDGFLEDAENFQEVYLSYGEYLDMADLVDSYVDAIIEK